MPGLAVSQQKKAPTASKAPATATPAPGPEADEEYRGNAAAQEEARSPEGTRAGLENYQAALGAWLGGELYKALAPHLTFDKVSGYATEALGSAASSLAGLLKKLDENADESDLEEFGQALSDKVMEEAEKWLETDDGRALVAALGRWVDTHPRTVVALALLAAAGAIVANAEIPELSKTFRLGENLEAGVSAKLGRLRDIALEQIKARLSWEAANLAASVEVERDAEGDVKGTVSGRIGDETRFLRADGVVSQDGIELYDVQGITPVGRGATLKGSVHGDKDAPKPKIGAEVHTADGRVERTRAVEYDANTGIFKVRDVGVLQLGQARVTRRVEGSSDGASRAGLALDTPMAVKGLSTSLAIDEIRRGGKSLYDLSPEQRAQLGLKYTKKDLEAQLDAMFSSTGARSVDLSLDTSLSEGLRASLSGTWEKDASGQETTTGEGRIDWRDGKGWQAGADARFEISDERALEVGAYFGFRSPDEFRTYLARYRWKLAEREHDVDVLIEEKLGEIYTRFQQKLVLTQQGARSESSLQGAWFADPDVALIAGVKYRVDDAGRDTWMPEAGVQVKGVPLTVTYDPSTKGVMVGITLPFGR